MTNPHIVVASTRRSWLPAQKRAILAEADDPATTASATARRHGLHSSGAAAALTPAQLAKLLEGIDWRTPLRTDRPRIAG